MLLMRSSYECPAAARGRDPAARDSASEIAVFLGYRTFDSPANISGRIFGKVHDGVTDRHGRDDYDSRHANPFSPKPPVLGAEEATQPCEKIGRMLHVPSSTEGDHH